MVVRTARRTLLIVGEGLHEEAFLKHVKQLYAPRGCGLAVTVKNAKGKGALHVVKWTINQIRNAEYDKVAAMLDTDTDWTPDAEALARARKIQVLASNPCFEAVMLRLLGQPADADARHLKKLLAPYLNDDPTYPGNYASHFDKTCLENGRSQEPSIDRLLKLFVI